MSVSQEIKETETQEQDNGSLAVFDNEELLKAVDEIIAAEQDKEETVSEEAEESLEKSSSEEEIEKSEEETESKEESDDLEKAGNVSTPAEPEQPKGETPGETPDEIADSKKKKKKDKDLGPTDGAGDKIQIGATTGQGATSESHSKEPEKGGLKKSIDELAEVVSALAEKVSKLEKSREEDYKSEESLRKSVAAEMNETLAKSYIAQIDDLKKANVAAMEDSEELRKELGEAKEKLEKATASSEELKKSLKKPASTRQSITNLDVIKKGEDSSKKRRTYETKTEVSDRLDELRKAGKVTDMDCISYNVSNFLSDEVKKLLREE